DVLRCAVGSEEGRRIVIVKRDEARHAFRHPHMAGKAACLGPRQAQPVTQFQPRPDRRRGTTGPCGPAHICHNSPLKLTAKGRRMTITSSLRAFLGQENVNFLLTNRIPRHAATRFMGWFSKIELPPVRALSIAGWKFFCDVDL